MGDSGDDGGQQANGGQRTDGGQRRDDEQRENAERGGLPCPICEEPMYSRHCKYVCPQHGVVYDCSDTFY